MPTLANQLNLIGGERVFGIKVDEQTRCLHWRGETDIIAIRFHCCRQWYSCYECHAACAAHEATVWPCDSWDTPAILCGGCGHQLSITQYMHCGSRCPACAVGFNPGCINHYHLYFATT